MQRPDTLPFLIQQLVTDLSLIDRNHYLVGTERRENDIEHSFSVAMLCWYIHSAHSLDLDISKILKYALAHDFVERYAGDTNTFASKKERFKKIEREKNSLQKLSEEFKKFPDMINIIQDYEAKPDEESLFVWTVDKMQALILGDLDGWRPYRELNIDYDWFCDKYREQLDGSSKYAHDIFDALISYCKTTYYDQPKV